MKLATEGRDTDWICERKTDQGCFLVLNLSNIPRYANSSVANVTVSDDGDPARDLSVPESNPGVTSQQLAKSSANAYAIEQPSSKGTLAKEELNLLAKLIGGGSAENSKDTFKLNLFDKQGAAM